MSKYNKKQRQARREPLKFEVIDYMAFMPPPGQFQLLRKTGEVHEMTQDAGYVVSSLYSGSSSNNFRFKVHRRNDGVLIINNRAVGQYRGGKFKPWKRAYRACGIVIAKEGS